LFSWRTIIKQVGNLAFVFFIWGLLLVAVLSHFKVLRAIGVGCLLVASALFIFLGYHWEWTGFPQKKLFDWIQILVIPVAVAVGTFVLNRMSKKRDEAAERAQDKRDEAARQAQKERDEEISEQRTQDAALQTYLDRMSLMLVERPLLTARPGEPLSVVARALTLTILERLDEYRKRVVLEFLYEAGLINRDRPVIDLGDTYPRANRMMATLGLEGDLAELYRGGGFVRAPGFESAQLQAATLARSHLRAAHLKGAHLQAANLEAADLREANLQLAHLKGASLREADLRGANLQLALVADEQLPEARSLQGATMPNGQKYEDWLKDKKDQGKDEKNESS
jgi:hypothetical protein